MEKCFLLNKHDRENCCYFVLPSPINAVDNLWFVQSLNTASATATTTEQNHKLMHSIYMLSFALPFHGFVFIYYLRMFDESNEWLM